MYMITTARRTATRERAYKYKRTVALNEYKELVNPPFPDDPVCFFVGVLSFLFPAIS